MSKMPVTSRFLRRSRQGFSLVELMVALTVLVVLLSLAVPSFREFIQVQRLRSVQAQILTDMQFARSTAVAQGQTRRVGISTWQSVFLVVRPSDSSMGCYVIFTDALNRPDACNCALSGAQRCPDTTNTREIRTVQLPASEGVQLTIPVGSTGIFEFSPVTGGQTPVISQSMGTVSYANAAVLASAGSTRSYRTQIAASGRPQACVPTGSTMDGTPC